MSWRFSPRPAPHRDRRWWIGALVLAVAAVVIAFGTSRKAKAVEERWPEEPPPDVDSMDARSAESQMTAV